MVEFMRISYIATLFYAPMALFVKVALLTLLARVFKPYRKWVLAINIILGIVLAYYIPAFIIKIRICNPISSYWYGTDRGGSCLDQGRVILADSVMSVVTDLAILILPLPLTWSLHMPLEKKLKVVGLLSAGGLATGFSLYRLVMIVQDGQSSDQTMVFTRVVLTGNAEGAVALICACLPALNILVSQIPKSSNASNSQGFQFSKIRRSRNDTTRKDHEDHEDGSGFCSDERTLISNIDASRSLPDSIDADGHMGTGMGIMKSVAVSQSVVVDKR
ncbi:conserved hypothetical protein [Talaromyces stipitatus ATCC 10500]|uniref:Rhodopsin domain-containing protein n=1 Tax=Talaromyces stipitatus (strain ATCC 10500 / CBS 375.48 / QM 6759 / NRRL 1006) TaxID=441959 RepID=B8LTW6_TALSN|nr:uncharacterized protein TSTA_071920 [Talaromyces stipitatus ATCC 10500]EED23796.1 conserved hypothetical protein [Talaromyces stipitatus ATCC 10500]